MFLLLEVARQEDEKENSSHHYTATQAAKKKNTHQRNDIYGRKTPLTTNTEQRDGREGITCFDFNVDMFTHT